MSVCSVFLLFVISTTSTAAAPSVASPQESSSSIRWLIWDFKPDFIRAGPFVGQGYGDKFLARLQELLPEYSHSQRVVNSKRWAVEAQRANTCTPLLWYGFLPEKIVYSQAYGLTPPYVVVAHEKNIPLFGKPGGSVSLQVLLERQNLTLGVLPVYMDVEQNNTRYPVLHSYLRPYLGTKKVREFGGGGNQLNLKLLEAGRVDYVIENPLTAPTEAKLNFQRNEFVNYSIKEHGRYKEIAVACVNDAFGKAVIEKINPHIQSTLIEEFLEYMEEWNENDAKFRQEVVKRLMNNTEKDNTKPQR